MQGKYCKVNTSCQLDKENLIMILKINIWLLMFFRHRMEMIIAAEKHARHLAAGIKSRMKMRVAQDALSIGLR